MACCGCATEGRDTGDVVMTVRREEDDRQAEEETEG